MPGVITKTHYSDNVSRFRSDINSRCKWSLTCGLYLDLYPWIFVFTPGFKINIFSLSQLISSWYDPGHGKQCRILATATTQCFCQACFSWQEDRGGVKWPFNSLSRYFSYECSHAVQIAFTLGRHPITMPDWPPLNVVWLIHSDLNAFCMDLHCAFPYLDTDCKLISGVNEVSGWVDAQNCSSLYDVLFNLVRNQKC